MGDDVGSGAATKEAKRNLKKAFGPEIADMLSEQQGLVQGLHNQHRVLARTIQDFETQLATVRAARAEDKKQHGARVDEAFERLDNLSGRLDQAIARMERKDAELAARILGVNTSMCRVLWWIRRRSELTRWQRFWSFVTGTCAITLDDFPEVDPARELAEIVGGRVAVSAVYEAKNGGPLERVS